MSDEPAFPRPNSDYSAAQVGMTLRDYFAAQALCRVDPLNRRPNELAEWAYEIADAMMGERQKGQS